jgi:PR domain zinc finger protein 13
MFSLFSDQNHYVCHKCRQIFENPNPLKIHLATDCGQMSLDQWWARLLPSPSTLSPSLPHPIIQPWNNHDRISAFRPVTSISPQSIIASPAPPPSPYISSTDHQSILQAAARLETIVSNMGTSKQGHVCIYCGKLYSRKYGLKIHIRTHTGFKPLKCKFCFRPFGDPSNLNKHVRLHVQSNSIYKCTLCNKILVRRRDLQRHLQTRHSLADAGSGIIKAVQHLPSMLSSSSSDDDENDRVGYLPIS